MPVESSPTPIEAFGTAVRDNDAARVAGLLASHPELKATINGPLPGGHFGATALIVAAQHANREMIEALLASGADVNQRSHWWAGGFSPLDDGENVPWLADFLIERGAVLDPPTAAQLGRLDELKALIAADPQAVHARGGDGQTALHRARTVEMAAYLLDHGADIYARDVDHESTPAQYLVRTRQDVVRYLVSRGCKTDILMAAAIGDVDLVRLHLDADPSTIRTRVNPQYFPMRNPHAGGTIYNWTLGWNKNAHVVAREFGHAEVYDLLMSRSPDGLKLTAACASGDEAMAKALLVSNAQLASALDDDDRRMLAHAARDNNNEAVRLMLDAGWPPDARGQHNGTALHWACFHGNAAMARELLRHGAPVNVKGEEYNATPLGWARHGSVHGWYSKTGDYDGTIKALLDAGASES
jgi:ankyrin repeat protein